MGYIPFEFKISSRIISGSRYTLTQNWLVSFFSSLSVVVESSFVDVTLLHFAPERMVRLGRERHRSTRERRWEDF